MTEASGLLGHVEGFVGSLGVVGASNEAITPWILPSAMGALTDRISV